MKFRSKYEKRVYGNRGRRPLIYEPSTPAIFYSTTARYTPDFDLGNGVLVECKGYFDSKARGKMSRVKKQHSHLDIRFLFQRASNRITKSPNSMTYWQWAEKHGYPWAEGDTIPEEWYE
jgi:hypothetical protein